MNATYKFITTTTTTTTKTTTKEAKILMFDL